MECKCLAIRLSHSEEMEHALEETNYCYTVDAQGLLMISHEDSLITPDGKNFLEEFTNVFLEELPHGLPPAR